MIDTERAMEVAAAEPISSLDLSMFEEQDIVNVILQRSSVLDPEGGARHAVKAWTDGDEKPILAVARQKGHELIRRAIALIFLEYLALKPVLDQIDIRRAADIGCGYAFFDLFLSRDFGSELVLIDTEASERRHFNYRDQGAAYASLSVAHDFLATNGVATETIETVNPELFDLGRVAPVDLSVSFLACGFHFPWQVYGEFLRNSVKPGGSVILDLRARIADEAQRGLRALGDVEVLGEPVPGKARRIRLIRKDTASYAA